MYSSKGLINQGWKDSHDSVFHDNGDLAEGPIALSEVQGYVYMAKLKASIIAATLGFSDKANKLISEAVTLKSKFNEVYWLEDLSTYALAIDGDKKRAEWYLQTRDTVYIPA